MNCSKSYKGANLRVEVLSPVCETLTLENFKKHLTNSTNYDILNTKRGEGKPHKPERAFIMKKNTMNTILSLIAGIETPEAEEVRAELTAELSKDAERKQANTDAYEAIHSLIVDNLTSTPVTCTELYNDIVKDLPSGMTKGKVQYALNNLWQDEIVKIPGKPNTYRAA